MRTPLLFDIPSEKPSLTKRLREFCKKHNLWTYHSPGCKDPWTVMAWKELADQCHTKCDGSEAGCFDLYGKYCSWADDAGLLVYGKGELSCVRQICRNLKIEDQLL